MIRHVVVLSWNDGAPEAGFDALESALRQLPAVIPEIRAYAVGRDLALVDGNGDLAVVADFEGPDEYRVYAENPDHQKVIRELVRPGLRERHAVQFQLP